ncbi:hypothetical protein IEQ34_009095 [Dendrobium chrysotoxum]|uniref:Small auxin up regulated protein n=1 Tax=Dendrobium chrysotoxum TaxID=161865 RepID=A0AAV7GI71_DENCH|nr:hypothetical protein IEQ34_009095 [Dendrobium chrysotoxum]
MDSVKASNKITDVVRLQQILKKWKKFAITQKSNSKKSISLLKKTFSFSDSSSVLNCYVPKGYLALCVGIEMKRFVIPMEYLRHKAFEVLLQEAEEEFGFHNEGVLRIPCEVSMFEDVLKKVDKKNKVGFRHCFSETDLSQVCFHQNECVGECYLELLLS